MLLGLNKSLAEDMNTVFSKAPNLKLLKRWHKGSNPK